MAEELDRFQQDRAFLDRAGDKVFEGNVDASSFSGDGSLLQFSQVVFAESGSEPDDPPAGYSVMWVDATTDELKIKITDGDGNTREYAIAPTNTDAFGRQRTSGTGQRLDVEFIYNKQPDFFDESTSNGTVTHNANSRDLTLSISDANNGTNATMLSHPIPYTPGNGHLIDMTGVLDNANIGGGTAQFFIRSNVTGSVVETATDQSNWMSLTSGVDWADSHIFQIDFQSLKVGTIRFFLVQNGLPVQVGQINNDNVRNTGYWQLASLPLCYRLYNDATYTYMEMSYGDESNAVGFRYRISANASATMKAICCTVKSEGGRDLKDMPGLTRSIDNGTSVTTVSTTLIPILSIRTRSTFNSLANLGISLPKQVQIQADDAIRLAVVFGGTLTGASWTNVNTNNSHTEYDVTASAISGGTEVFSDYVPANSSGPAATRFTGSELGILSKTVLWDRQGSETGILSVCAIRTAATDADCLAALQWDEIR